MRFTMSGHAWAILAFEINSASLNAALLSTAARPTKEYVGFPEIIWSSYKLVEAPPVTPTYVDWN